MNIKSMFYGAFVLAVSLFFVSSSFADDADIESAKQVFEQYREANQNHDKDLYGQLQSKKTLEVFSKWKNDWFKDIEFVKATEEDGRVIMTINATKENGLPYTVDMVFGIRPTNPSMNCFDSAIKYRIIITTHRRCVDEENLSIEEAMAKNTFCPTYQRFINFPILQ